jgi:Recombination endonuclease VII
MGRFVDEYGLVQYRPSMHYTYAGSCEISGCSALRVSLGGKKDGPSGPWSLSGREDSPLYLDHCHAHSWIRGHVCASCNSVIRHLDKRGYLLRYRVTLREAYRAHLNQCPDCTPIQLLATDYEINYAYTLTLPESSFKAAIVKDFTQEMRTAAGQLGMTLDRFTAHIRDFYPELRITARMRQHT